MPIIGTAGHVDHGKSTLVRALTGRDPDRWQEEKRRGLTIDLGFAWTELVAGTTVGFVDVPGHERFIKNMLAGVGAIDACLFVVAADEGWMPQSEEHLAVLDLLGIRRGVIALSRIDVVDDDLVDLAELEVSEQVAGTTLEDWPVVRVSPVTGAGMPELRRHLTSLIDGPRDAAATPRLWIDRVFTVAGAGAVVTGTLTGGPLAVGDEVAVLPAELSARVRGLQSYERSVESVSAGTRAAVNLAGVDARRLARGMLVTQPGSVRTTERMVVQLRVVRSHDAGITDRGAFHLHAGTGAWPVRVRTLESGVIESTGAALFTAGGPVPALMGDRFVLRDVGRRAVVAGGLVLDPDPQRRAADIVRTLPLLRRAITESPQQRAATLLEIRGAAPVAALAADSGGELPEGALVAGGTALSARTVSSLEQDISQAATAYQSDNPLRPGIPKATLASRLGVTAEVVELVVSRSQGELVDDGASIRTGDFSGGWSEHHERQWAAARTVLESAGAAAPRASQLDLDDEVLHALLREGRLIRVGDDLVYLPEQLEAIRRILEGLPTAFTVADFRDAAGISRRQAVPLLEWFDASGITLRRGDTRELRSPPSPPAVDDARTR